MVRNKLIIGLILVCLFATPCYAAQKVAIDYPNTPIVYNKTLTSANTEYSQALPSGCTKIMAQCRTAYDVKITYTSGESGTTYYTIKANTWYWDDGIFGTKQVLYMQSTQANVIIEIIAWY